MPLRRLRGNCGLGENVHVAMLAVDGMKPLCAGCQQKVGPCSTAMHWWFIWIAYLLTWAVLPHILTRNKPPASTLAWSWAVILFPYGGAIFYFLFGTDRRRSAKAARPARLGRWSPALQKLYKPPRIEKTNLGPNESKTPRPCTQSH